MSDHSEDATLTREGMRTPRAAAVAGIAFSVLLMAAFVLVRWALLGDPDSSGEWITDGSRRDAVRAGVEPAPVRRDRLPVVHGGAPGPDRRERRPLLRHGVPRERAAVRRHGVRLRGGGGGSRVVVRRVESPSGRALVLWTPRRGHPSRGLRAAHGRGLHDLDHDDRVAPGAGPAMAGGVRHGDRAWPCCSPLGWCRGSRSSSRCGCSSSACTSWSPRSVLLNRLAPSRRTARRVLRGRPRGTC